MFSAKLVGKQMDVCYDLYLPEYTVPAPEVQTNYKEIPFRDGALDKTAPDGVVHYNDREWELIFQSTGRNVSAYDVPKLAQALMNDLHGRDGEIIFDDDETYKWIGRVFVDEVYCEENGLISAVIKLITQPYKYKVIDVEKTVSLSSTAKTISLLNGRKPIIPKVIVSDSAELAFTVKGVNYTSNLSAGTFSLPDLVLFEGTTNVSATGSGMLTITYPEASL